MTFELYQDGERCWRWRLRDEAAAILAISPEGYSNKKWAYAVIDEILKMDIANVIDAKV